MLFSSVLLANDIGDILARYSMGMGLFICVCFSVCGLVVLLLFELFLFCFLGLILSLLFFKHTV